MQEICASPTQWPWGIGEPFGDQQAQAKPAIELMPRRLTFEVLHQNENRAISVPVRPWRTVPYTLLGGR